MLEQLKECPICRGTDFTAFIRSRDFLVTHETFDIVSCNHCGFKFTNPRPHENQLTKYYQSSQYISHSNKNNSLINFIYKNVRKITVRQKARLLTSFTNRGNLLDYGCGTGEFLKACKDMGWRITGVEPAGSARHQAINLTGSEIFGSIFEGEYERTFNAITLWHVLEHIPNLEKTLTRIKQLLDPSGRLFVAVPNYQSPDARWYDHFWAGYDLPRHLYHFDKDSVFRLLKNHHLVVEHIIPQKLDAYYVSLLSEKNRSKPTQFLRAMINGYRSNQQAKTKQPNYSSLIYVAKHE